MYSYAFYSGVGWWQFASIAMNLGAAIALLLSIALLFAGSWLFAARFSPILNSGRLYRTACHLARFAPAGLLVSLAMLAFGYSPVLETINAYLYRPISIGTMRNVAESYASIYYAQDFVRSSPSAMYHPMFWLIVTVLGILTILMIIARNILNRTMRLKTA